MQCGHNFAFEKCWGEKETLKYKLSQISLTEFPKHVHVHVLYSAARLLKHFDLNSVYIHIFNNGRCFEFMSIESLWFISPTVSLLLQC